MSETKLCPVTKFTQIMGGKWKLRIINAIRKHEKLRFGKLHVLVAPISRKVLADQLKELERDHLIIRKQFAEIPPRVEYSLTTAASQLCSVFSEIESWSDHHYK